MRLAELEIDMRVFAFFAESLLNCRGASLIGMMIFGDPQKDFVVEFACSTFLKFRKELY